MKITVEDAKAAKAALEHTIAAALRQFTADTGTTVEHVDIAPVISPGEPAGYRGYRVQVEARL